MTRRIAVIFGGVSTEYIISLRSAFNVLAGLYEAGFDLIRIGITRDGRWLRYEGPDQGILDDSWHKNAVDPDSNSGQAVSPREWFIRLCGGLPDCVFPAVHGINCEDGALQGLLTLIGVPYVGSGILASAAAMDKVHSKRILRDADIPVSPFISLSRPEIESDLAGAVMRVESSLAYPCFLKPSNGGSSVGTRRANDREELKKALQYVMIYDREVLVEPYIHAREIEVAVLGNHQLKTGAIGEIITRDQEGYYDYQTKYFSDDGAMVKLPADLDPQTAATITAYARDAYQILGCAGLARVDFFLDKQTGQIFLNEVNTLPGFTPISVYPKAFARTGMTLADLVSRLCELAMAEFAARSRQECLE